MCVGNLQVCDRNLQVLPGVLNCSEQGCPEGGGVSSLVQTLKKTNPDISLKYNQASPECPDWTGTSADQLGQVEALWGGGGGAEPADGFCVEAVSLYPPEDSPQDRGTRF